MLVITDGRSINTAGTASAANNARANNIGLIAVAVGGNVNDGEISAIADDPDMSSKITIGKLNIDDSPEPAGAYGVRNIPTLMLFKGGQVVGTLVGTNSRGQIETFIKDNIG